ncbi:hypothetical protein UF16_07510 [Chromobacterium violaceum]|nr:hypothetical protein UF16_07510 [Chromobacterium violaceum]
MHILFKELDNVFRQRIRIGPSTVNEFLIIRPWPIDVFIAYALIRFFDEGNAICKTPMLCNQLFALPCRILHIATSPQLFIFLDLDAFRWSG